MSINKMRVSIYKRSNKYNKNKNIRVQMINKNDKENRNNNKM